MNPIAPRWKFWLARIFGTKRVGRDSGVTVTMYLWRGRVYVTKMEEQ